VTGPKEQERLGNGFSTIFDLLMSDKHTNTPGLVVSFNAEERTISVQPVLFRGETESRLLPIETDVPVNYPGSDEYELAFELKEGDKVLLVTSERSIDDWMASGEPVEPADPRRFDLSDAIAIAGLTTAAQSKAAVGPGITLRKADDTIALSILEDMVAVKAGDMTFEVTAGGVRAKPTGVTPALADVEAYQPLVVTPPGVGPGYVSLVAHTHQVISVGAPTGLPIPTGLGLP
jgi:hypothetical protein